MDEIQRIITIMIIKQEQHVFQSISNDYVSMELRKQKDYRKTTEACTTRGIEYLISRKTSTLFPNVHRFLN